MSSNNQDDRVSQHMANVHADLGDISPHPRSSDNTRPQIIPPDLLPPDIPVDLTDLTTAEQTVYRFLQSQGWTDAQCSSYFTSIMDMKEALSGHFRAQGWTDDQLQAFDRQCDIELPDPFPAPSGDDPQEEDYQMQIRLLDEMNRRKAIGERMHLAREQ